MTTTVDDEPATPRRRGVAERALVDGEPGDQDWRRHPADVARLVAATLALGLVLLLALTRPDAVRGFSADFARLVRGLPDVVDAALLGIAQVLALVVPIGIVVAYAAQRRLRVLLVAVGAAVVAATAMAALQDWLDRIVPRATLAVGRVESWITGASFPSGAYLAGLTAALVVLVARSSRSWRRAAWTGLTIVMLVRTVTAAAVPLNLAVTVALGAVVGSLALVVFGAPTRRVALGELTSGLARVGLRVTELVELPDRRGHTRSFRGVTHDGEAFEVRLVGRDERDAALILRAYRTLQVKGIDQPALGWSADRAVEDEALALLLAQSAGARAPSAIATGRAAESAFLAARPAPGRRLGDLEPDLIDDALLDDVWRQLDALHRRAIAHGTCNADNVIVDRELGAGLTGFARATPAADDRSLAADVAELACSLALVVGAERTAASAARVLPRARIADALPLMQPVVLSPELRGRLRRDGEVLPATRDALQEAAGVDRYELAEVKRVTIGGIVSLAGAVFLTLVVLSFVANWDSISDALGEADWGYVPPIVVLAGLSYPAGALSLMGAVTRPIPLLGTAEVMLGGTFLNRFTPANAGGMALRARFLQKRGVELPVAAASIALASAASGVAQVVVIIVFAVWAGSSDDVGFSLPAVDSALVVVLIALVAAGGVLVTPWGRRVVLGRLRVEVGKVWHELTELARSPGKLTLLLGGAVLAKLITILAFVLSCRALGIDTSFARLGFLYMTANTIASAAPTPGGLGAIEAALVAALTGVGVESAVAVSAVVVFRAITFWLPVVPAWFALHRLRRADLV